MRQLLRSLWRDDAGSVLAAEWLLIATILVMAAGVLVTSVRETIVTAWQRGAVLSER